jgi:hypothetical protein
VFEKQSSSMIRCKYLMSTRLMQTNLLRSTGIREHKATHENLAGGNIWWVQVLMCKQLSLGSLVIQLCSRD